MRPETAADQDRTAQLHMCSWQSHFLTACSVIGSTAPKYARYKAGADAMGVRHQKARRKQYEAMRRGQQWPLQLAELCIGIGLTALRISG